MSWTIGRDTHVRTTTPDGPDTCDHCKTVWPCRTVRAAGANADHWDPYSYGLQWEDNFIYVSDDEVSRHLNSHRCPCVPTPGLFTHVDRDTGERSKVLFHRRFSST